MTKSFIEKMEELAGTVKLTEKGKEKKSFNKTQFEELFVSFLNEHDYKAESVSKKGDGVVAVEIEAVKNFRKTFYDVLVDFGVDKQAAEAMLDGSYQFSKVSGGYEFISELLYSYLQSKAFKFVSHADFAATLSIESIGEKVGEFRVPVKAGEEPKPSKKKKIKAHKKLKVKSGAPSWAKIDIND